MAGPFRPAEERQLRLKAFFYGESGSGKTFLSLQFPAPCVIDLEGGTTAYGGEFDFDVLDANDPESIMQAVRWLASNDHPYKTLIVDPITLYWEALQQKWHDIFLERKQGSRGFKFEFFEMSPGDWRPIKNEYKQFIRYCMMLDMNVIFTAHAKPEYAGGSGGDFMKIVGETFNAEKSTHYYADVVLHMARGREGGYFAKTIKDRNRLLPIDEAFAVDYEVFSALFGGDMDRASEPVLSLATDSQKEEIRGYLEALELTEEEVAPRLREYDAESIEDLTKEAAEAILGRLSEAVSASV